MPETIDLDDSAYPPDLKHAETQLLRTRQRLGEDEVPLHLVGLALSGGGIRTATVSLGFLQAMARADRLRHVDYLSTVSGGSYLGAFLGGLFQPRKLGGAKGARSIDDVQKLLADPSSRELHWLRENGRYLAPAAGADEVLGLASYLRNLFSTQLVMALPLLAVFIAAFAMRPILFDSELEQQLFAWTSHGIWPSPYLSLALVPFLLAGVFGAAFWLMPGQSSNPWSAIAPWLTAIGIGAVAGWMQLFDPFALSSDSMWRIAESWLTWWVVLTLLCALSSILWVMGTLKTPRIDLPVQRAARAKLSAWLGVALVAGALMLAFAVADSAGQTLYAYLRSTDRSWALWASLPASALSLVAALVRSLFGRLATREPSRPQLPLTVLAAAGAMIVFTLYSVGVATLAHAIGWGFMAPVGGPWNDGGALALPNAGRSWLAFAGVLALAIALGRSWAFLNLSTLQALYAGRLTRAYLGASNEGRHVPGSAPLSDPIKGDDIPFSDYRPWQSGGPLHLIGITINETISGETHTEYRDRKGIGFTVGPAGLSAGVNHHALWSRPAGKYPPFWQRVFATLNIGTPDQHR